MAKFLGQTGLIYLWSKIKLYVQGYAAPKLPNTITGATKTKITYNNNGLVTAGADLQEADIPNLHLTKITDVTATATEVNVLDGITATTSDLNKTSGIEAGAEVNQNAFSNVKVGSSTIAADAKTDTLEIAAGSNGLITITPDTANDKITIAVDNDLSNFDNTNSGFITASDLPAGMSPYTSNPAANGIASPGSSDDYARGDHVHPSDSTKVDVTAIGAPNGICPLGADTKISQDYLPSYVDDVVEAYIRDGQTALSSTWLATVSSSGTVIVPESGKIYVLMNSSNDYPENTEFRWGGSTYVKINDGGITEMTTSEMDTATNNWT